MIYTEPVNPPNLRKTPYLTLYKDEISLVKYNKYKFNRKIIPNIYSKDGSIVLL